MEIILNLLKTINIGDYTFEKQIGLTRGTISNWKKGINKPSADALTKLADYFDVSVDYLLGRTKKEAQIGTVTPQYSAKEIAIIDIYRHCPPETKIVIESMIFSLKKEDTSADIG